MTDWKLFWIRAWQSVKAPLVLLVAIGLFTLALFYDWAMWLWFASMATMFGWMIWETMGNGIKRWFHWQFIEPLKGDEKK